MEFKIKEKLPQTVDYAVNVHGDRCNEFINAIADKLTDEEYHELCHQLNGTKSEFDGADDGEVHLEHVDKKYYTVKSALYRGIFWSTLARLDSLDESKFDEEF